MDLYPFKIQKMYRQNKSTEIYVHENEKGKIEVRTEEKTNGDTSIHCNVSTDGEFIEQKVERIMNNDEPIEDGAEQIFTERKDGVIPEYNIRTDRFDMALEMTDQIASGHRTKREDAIAERKRLLDEANGIKDGEPESTQGQGKTTE